MRQAVDEVEIDRGEAGFTQPGNDLFGHGLGLNPMDRFLYFWIEILHAQRGPIKPGFAQGAHVFAREPARINFNTGFEITGKLEMLANDGSKAANLVRRKEGRRTP